MFLKDELEILLDKRRDKELREVAKVIKRCIIGYLARKRFLEKRAAIMLIQKVYKVYNFKNITTVDRHFERTSGHSQ